MADDANQNPANDTSPRDSTSAKGDVGDANNPDFTMFTEWYHLDDEHTRGWKENAALEFDFVAGHQWEEEDKQALAEQNRPCITMNRIGPMIDTVCGLEINNRQEVNYIPRKASGTPGSDVVTSAAKWFRDQADAADEESTAFRDAVICGMGWIDSRLDFIEDQDGAPIVEHIDAMEMSWDYQCKKKNLKDARRLWRVRDISIDDAKRLVPGADEELLDAAWARHEKSAGVRAVRRDPPFYDGKNSGRDTGERDDRSIITFVECQYFVMVPVYRVAGSTGNELKLSEEEHTELKERADIAGVPFHSVKQMRKQYRRAFIGAEVLKDEELISETDFTYQAVTGKWDQNKRHFYGVVRAMVDPQRWANKWLSQTLHIMNSNAKGGILAEMDAFEDHAEAEKTWARTDSITWAKKGALQNNKIQPKPMVQFPQGFFDLTQFAISSIRDTTGINLELMGLKEQDQAGVLEEKRKQSAITLLAGLFDSLKFYRKRQGRVLLIYLTKHLPDGKLIKIIKGDGEEAFIPYIKNPDFIEYEVVVDDAPTSANQKEKVWGMFTQIAPMLGPEAASPGVMNILLEYSPLPAVVTAKLKQVMQQMASQPNPEQQAKQQEAQLKAQELQAKIAEMQQKGKEAQMSAQIKAMEMQNKRMEIQMKAGDQAHHQAQVQIKQLEIQLEAKKHSDGMALKAAQEQTKRAKFASDAKLAKAKLGLEANAQGHDLAKAKMTNDSNEKIANTKATIDAAKIQSDNAKSDKELASQEKMFKQEQAKEKDSGKPDEKLTQLLEKLTKPKKKRVYKDQQSGDYILEEM
jgi:hypothetical protein